MKQKVYVIINPKSGTNSKSSIAIKIAEAFDGKKSIVHFFYTSYAGHATELAREALKNDVDLIIAVGGDGTVNEIGKVIINSNVKLGIIPMGSGNGLSRELKIPLDFKKAIEIIKNGKVKKMDYGVANGHVFFCTCGMGFDAEVAERAYGRKHRGAFMYFKDMVNTFFEQEPLSYDIECPNGHIKTKAFVVVCANTSQYGYNAYIAPKADVSDGKMNLVILQPLKIIDVPKTSLQLFSKKIDQNKKMEQILTSQAIITRKKEGIMHIDGDTVPCGKTIEVKIVPKGLNVIIP